MGILIQISKRLYFRRNPPAVEVIGARSTITQVDVAEKQALKNRERERDKRVLGKELRSWGYLKSFHNREPRSYPQIS